jgi:hypothetical protein
MSLDQTAFCQQPEHQREDRAVDLAKRAQLVRVSRFRPAPIGIRRGREDVQVSSTPLRIPVKVIGHSGRR